MNERGAKGQEHVTLSIPGWPIVAPGLLMITVDNVVFMHLDDRMADDAFALYLRALDASLSHRQPPLRVAVIYDIPTFGGLRALGTRASADILKRHASTLRETTACFALVSQSSIARAAVQAAFAVSRLSFPQRTFTSVSAALVFAATLLPEINPYNVERRIDEALGTHLRGMRLTP